MMRGIHRACAQQNVVVFVCVCFFCVASFSGPEILFHIQHSRSFHDIWLVSQSIAQHIQCNTVGCSSFFHSRIILLNIYVRRESANDGGAPAGINTLWSPAVIRRPSQCAAWIIAVIVFNFFPTVSLPLFASNCHDITRLGKHSHTFDIHNTGGGYCFCCLSPVVMCS